MLFIPNVIFFKQKKIDESWSIGPENSKGKLRVL